MVLWKISTFAQQSIFRALIDKYFRINALSNNDKSIINLFAGLWRHFPVWRHICLPLQSLQLPLTGKTKTCWPYLKNFILSCFIYLNFYLFPYDHCNCHWQVRPGHVDHLNINNLILSCFIHLNHTCPPNTIIVIAIGFDMLTI